MIRACVFALLQRIFPALPRLLERTNRKEKVRPAFERLEIRAVLNNDDSIAGDWETYGNGPGHTGYVSGILGAISDVPSWEWELPKPSYRSDAGQVVTGMGLAFIAGGERLTALDQNTGRVVWDHVFGEQSILGPPSFEDGQVFLVRKGMDEQLWAFDALTGQINWTTPFGSSYYSHSLQYAPTVADGRIYLSSHTSILGFSASTGENLFVQRLHPYGLGDAPTPAVVDGKLYSWFDGNVSLHSPETGEYLWKLDVWPDRPSHSGGTSYGPVVVSNGTAFVNTVSPSSFENCCIAIVDVDNRWLRSKSGSTYWTYHPAVAGDTYFYSEDKVLHQRSIRYASFTSYGATENIRFQPIVTDDAIIVTGESKTFIFDRATNKLRTTLPVSGQISLGNHTLFIVQERKRAPVYFHPERVYAFKVNGAHTIGIQAPMEVSEKSGRFIGTISIDTAPTSQLVFRLTSSDPNRLRVPTEVRMNAGEKSVSFEGIIVDNRDRDAVPTVRVTAKAPGFEVVVDVRILDDDEDVVLGSINSDWTMDGFDPARSGHVPGYVGTSFNAQPLWTKEGAWGQILSQDGVAYMIERIESVYLVAFDSQTGEELWRTYLFDRYGVVKAIVYADRRIYLATFSYHSDSTQIWSFRADDGIAVWQTTVAYELTDFVSMAVRNGLVYVSLKDNGLRFANEAGVLGLRLEDGAIAYQVGTAGYDPFFSIHDNLLISSSYRDGLFRVSSLDDSSKSWYLNFETMQPCACGSGPPLNERKKAYLFSWNSDSTYAIDVERKEFLWKIPHRWSRSAVHDGVLYLFDQSLVKAYDANTGSPIAIYDAWEPLIGSPIVTEDAIVVTSQYKTIVLDKVTRSKRAVLPIGGAASIANNTLFVASVNFSISNLGQAFQLAPKPKISVELPTEANEKSGRWTGKGIVKVESSFLTDLTLTVSSTALSRLAVTKEVTIKAGTTSSKFDFEIFDNQIVDSKDIVKVFVTSPKLAMGIGQVKIVDDDFHRETKLDGDWNAAGNNQGRTGYFPGTVGTQLKSELLWSVKDRSISIMNDHPVVVHDGVAYITLSSPTHRPSLVAMDLTSGSEKWRLEATDDVSLFGELAILGENIYFTASGRFSEVWSVASNGRFNWKTTLSNGIGRAAPILVGNTLLMGGDGGGGIYGLDVVSGWPKFFKAYDKPTPWNPSVAGKRFFLWDGVRFQEHSPETGEAIWQVELNTNSDIRETFAAVHLDTAIVVADSSDWLSGGRSLYAIDLNERRIKWSVLGVYSSSPAIAGDVVFAVEGPVLRAFDIRTGALLASYLADAHIQKQPIVTDDSIVVSTVDKTLIFDRMSREVRLSIPLSGTHIFWGGTPILSGDTLLLTVQEGLFAYALQRPLQLEADTQLLESSTQPITIGKVTLSTPAESDVRIKLETTDPYRIKLPPEVLIRQGTRSASFPIEALDNKTVESYIRFSITASGPGFRKHTLGFVLIDDEPSFLRMTVPDSILEGTNDNASIYVESAPSQDTTIELSSSNVLELFVPQTVTLKAFSHSVGFQIKANDDALEDGSKPVEVRANAKGWSGIVRTTKVTDNEIPTLRLTMPELIREDAGTVIGTVSIPYARDTDTTIEISSSDDHVLVPPSSVTIKAGQASAPLTIAIVNDGFVLGPKEIMVTARSIGFISVTRRIVVTDDEAATLSVVVPSEVSEGSGIVASAGRVVFSRPVDRDTTIQLRSSDASRIELPASVVVRAREVSATFSLNVLNNYRVEGKRGVSIVAAIPGWMSSSAVVQVTDDDRLGLSGNWPVLGNTPGREGFFSGYIGTQPHIVSAWSRSIGNQLLNEPSTGEGLVFTTPRFGFGTLSLVATRIATGDETWKHTFALTSSVSAPTYDSGKVFVVSSSSATLASVLWAFDANSGKMIWSNTLPSLIATPHGPLVSGSHILVSDSISGSLYAFDESTGEISYVRLLEYRSAWLPSEKDGMIFIWSHGRFNAIDGSNGETKWTLLVETPANDSEQMTVPIVHNSTAYMVDRKGLYAVDLKQRKLLWKVAGSFDNPPSVSRSTVFATQQGRIRQFDAISGADQGSISFEGTSKGSIMLTDDSILVPTETKTVVLNRETGKTVESIPVVGEVVLSDDHLLIASDRLFSFSVNPAMPWTNPIDNKDVDADGSVSPIDVLALINHLNLSGSYSLPKDRLEGSYFLDVNRDSAIGPLDVLMVINWLNLSSSSGEGEGKTQLEDESWLRDLALMDFGEDLDERQRRKQKLNQPTSSNGCEWKVAQGNEDPWRSIQLRVL